MFESLKTRRLLQTMLVCVLGVVMLGATDPAARYGRVGHNLMCVCSCGQILVECNHVGCPDSARMTGELRDQLNGPGGGGPDGTILKWFADKYGAVVLAAPIRGGFDTLAWILPFSIFLLATLGTAMLVRMWAQKRQFAAAGMPVFRALPDDAMRERIRRETEWQ